ncbi:glycoside hydrolase family 78 protein [Cadophora sp. DSE1049]|nr:glycoside hydrolase family 78 protein [Cadophora sp. DSE1049]
MSCSIGRIQLEHHRDALGIGERAPRISWRFGGEAKNWTQAAYEIEITDVDSQTSKVYKATSSASVLVPWPGQPLQTGKPISVRVRAYGSSSSPGTAWSDSIVAEAGLLERTDWFESKLISATHVCDPEAPKIPVLLRRKFANQSQNKRARLYITAHGVYEAHINGQRVGTEVLAPGFTSYSHRLTYQTFDVTDLIRSGQNVLTAQVAEGWFAGRLGFLGPNRNIWGKTVGLIAKLVLTSDDGDVTVISTDSEWTSGTGAIQTSELYDGEVCDLQLEPEGWLTAEFDDSKWDGVITLPLPESTLVAPDGPPVRKIEEIKAVATFKSPSGKTIVDFGQNLVGWVRVNLSGPKGQVVVLLHTEVLEHGEVATRPLRGCKATDTIILSGRDQIWEPKFTFHGFRYVQVDGWPSAGELKLDDLTAIVVHTDMEETGWFECSNALLNKLHQNIRWGIKGNFLSIPTDCPQRDERLGWTGDIHVFAPTANYYYDTCGMLLSWSKDLAAEQMADGSGIPPYFSPNVFPDHPKVPKVPTAIWGDVVVGLPWSLFKSFGDREILSQHLESMQAWINHGIVRDETTHLWKDRSYQFGDWLDPKAPADEPGTSMTDPDLVANAYLIHITTLMYKISLALNLSSQAKSYASSIPKLKAAYQNRYITSEGRVVADTQTALALSINFDLFASPAQQAVAASRLRDLILRNSRFKIETGFAGTPAVGHALSKIGSAQLFYRMLYHKKAPSWLYQVTMGATTMWERWDSMLPDGSINPGEMTSFNHYALGAVADWMHSNIAGLTCIEPGWRKFRVAPVPGGDLEFANASFMSPYGKIEIGWKIDEERFRMSVTVPPNTLADIILPGAAGKDKVIIVGSGKHDFENEYVKPEWPPLPHYPDYHPHDDDVP